MMMNTLQLFFQLLQVAVGNREKLTLCLSEKEWALLYALCKRQSLVGIGFAGIQRLPREQRPPLRQLAQWFSDSEKIKEKNHHLTEMCATVSKQLLHDGLWNCILKGQSNQVNYPEWLRDYRTPGDIDVWCAPIDNTKSEKAVIKYALSLAGGTKPEVRYHHTDLPHVWDVEVELHHRPSFMCSPLRNIRLRNWCRNYEKTLSVSPVKGEGIFPVPTPSFNTVYQLVHIYRHLFDEGIGLRQILDYYFVLRETPSSSPQGGVISREEIMHTISSFGMKKFASAVMYVLKTVFAMPDEYLLCPSNEKEGRFLLREILMAGNFGRYDKRISHGGNALHHNWEKLKHNFRLVRHYPEEVLWEPVFRIYHFLWRRLALWRY